MKKQEQVDTVNALVPDNKGLLARDKNNSRTYRAKCNRAARHCISSTTLESTLVESVGGQA